MKKIDCWRLESVSDVGPNGLVARFASEQAANDARPLARGYGPKVLQETIEIWDSHIEFRPETDEVTKL